MVACIAFGIQFNIKPFHLVAAAIGAFLSAFINNIFQFGGMSAVLACFVAAICVSIYSEIMARRFKAPVNMYLIIGIIPLVPGSAIYDTMISLVDSNGTEALDKAIDAFGIAGAIAIGIFVVSSIVRFVSIKIER